MSTAEYGNGRSMRLYAFMFYYGYAIILFVFMFELYNFTQAFIDLGSIQSIADNFMYFTLDILFIGTKGILMFRLWKAKKRYAYELFSKALMFIYVLGLFHYFIVYSMMFMLYGYSLRWLGDVLASTLVSLCINVPIYRYLNKRLPSPIKGVKAMWFTLMDTLFPIQLKSI